MAVEEGALALALQGWSATSAGPPAALCAAVGEVVGDFLVECVAVVLVVVLEVGVSLTLVAAKASPLVWPEEVDVGLAICCAVHHLSTQIFSRCDDLFSVCVCECVCV